MDQLAQRVGDLGRPQCVGMDLACAVEIPKEVLGAELVDELAEFEGVVDADNSYQRFPSASPTRRRDPTSRTDRARN